MKNRIIAFLSLLFVIFSIGAVISMLYIRFTTSELEKIITLHSVEILRQDLVIKIQNVEKDLLTVHTEFGGSLDNIVSNVVHLDSAVRNCNSCHHSPMITKKLGEIKDLVGRFKSSLSYYITASANEELIDSLKAEAYDIATELVNVASEMTLIANQRLQERTLKAIDDVKSAQRILLATMLIAFLIGLWTAVSLTRRILRPIRELISVTRKIAGGHLGYVTGYSDSTEFGELASTINEMSVSLRQSNEKIVQHMDRLSTLYRITLPFHSISNIREILREVSDGVANLIEVEQSGLLLPDETSEYLEHKFPAYGLDEDQVRSIRVNRKEIAELFSSGSEKPLIVNDLSRLDVPEGLTGGSTLKVHNMLLGWVRLEGELIGIMRLANRKNGEFGEEAARMVGIISNNVSVAIENSILYEDLKMQMREMEEMQEQLIQAAKLAAIGELASNVAHEINNPLTSIMGYTDLISEETSIENIMHDIEIIARESMRAREIVRQLLEFAKKRPLELKSVDINSLLHEAVALVCVHNKDASIRISEYYSPLPVITGDPNQLKQVFLNIINNSVQAMTGDTDDMTPPRESKDISISTEMNESGISIKIRDNGHGIPGELLPRIFEPFFTTKKERGTGLGLSITYKIIQSHKGKIDVESEQGKGTMFTIYLPFENVEHIREHTVPLV
jgi:signal transduction histidine kinase/HAMP domain-containing protein